MGGIICSKFFYPRGERTAMIRPGYFSFIIWSTLLFSRGSLFGVFKFWCKLSPSCSYGERVRAYFLIYLNLHNNFFQTETFLFFSDNKFWSLIFFSSISSSGNLGRRNSAKHTADQEDQAFDQCAQGEIKFAGKDGLLYSNFISGWMISTIFFENKLTFAGKL